MTETDPAGGSEKSTAGDVGARRQTVGMPTDHESINVPPTRPGAAENALAAEAAREPHETFVPEAPVPDDRMATEENDRRDIAEGDEEEQVRKDISKTRKDLGDTVEALADKMDVKGRASGAADAAKDKAGAMADAAKDKAAVVADTAKDKAAVMAESAKDAADTVTTEAKKRPVLLLAAAGAVLALIIRRMIKRGK